MALCIAVAALVIASYLFASYAAGPPYYDKPNPDIARELVLEFRRAAWRKASEPPDAKGSP